jgi:Protein kinase domain
MEELRPPTTLSHYRIVSKIGAGGMGEVYLAEDTKLDRRVALKILPADVSADETRMRRFVQEAKADSALNHPNIITIHEIEHIDSVNFIVTEFIDGETLRQRVKAEMKLGEILGVGTVMGTAFYKSPEQAKGAKVLICQGHRQKESLQSHLALQLNRRARSRTRSRSERSFGLTK